MARARAITPVFWPAMPAFKIWRTLSFCDVVSGSSDTEILVDGQEVPYARELWIPLVRVFAVS